MKLVPEAISRTVARNALLVQKGSPGLLFGAGVVGMVGSTVLACRATLKMDTVLDEAKDKLEIAKTLEHPDYSEKDRGKIRHSSMSRRVPKLSSCMLQH